MTPDLSHELDNQCIVVQYPLYTYIYILACETCPQFALSIQCKMLFISPARPSTPWHAERQLVVHRGGMELYLLLGNKWPLACAYMYATHVEPQARAVMILSLLIIIISISIGIITVISIYLHCVQLNQSNPLPECSVPIKIPFANHFHFSLVIVKEQPQLIVTVI